MKLDKFLALSRTIAFAVLCGSVGRAQAGDLVNVNGANFPVKADVGDTIGNAWGFWQNGYIETIATFPSSGTYNFVVNGYGYKGDGIWPAMEVRIDGIAVNKFDMNTVTSSDHAFSNGVASGAHKIEIAFVNYTAPATSESQKRNPFVANLRVSSLAAPTPPTPPAPPNPYVSLSVATPLTGSAIPPSQVSSLAFSGRCDTRAEGQTVYVSGITSSPVLIRAICKSGVFSGTGDFSSVLSTSPTTFKVSLQAPDSGKWTSLPITLRIAGIFAHESVTILGLNGLQVFGDGSANCSGSGCSRIDYIASMGGNDVTLNSVTNIARGSSTFASDLDTAVNYANLKTAVLYARSKGLSVTLKPMILPWSSSLNYNAVPASGGYVPTDAKAFYDALEHHLLMYAKLAKEAGATLLYIGTEYGGLLTGPNTTMNLDNCARWHTMFADLRAANATLKLTYAATLAPQWDYTESNDATRVCFWDAMDYIGFDAYPELNNMPSSSNSKAFYDRMFDNGLLPGSSDGTASADFSLSRYMTTFGLTHISNKLYVDFVADTINAQRAKKNLPALQTLLTEVGVTSTNSAYDYWGDYDSTAANFDAQAQGWDGYLGSFAGDARIYGISVFALQPYGNLATHDQESNWSTNFSVNSKPAEKVLCKWFSGNLAPLCK